MSYDLLSHYDSSLIDSRKPVKQLSAVQFAPFATAVSAGANGKNLRKNKKAHFAKNEPCNPCQIKAGGSQNSSFLKTHPKTSINNAGGSQKSFAKNAHFEHRKNVSCISLSSGSNLCFTTRHCGMEVYLNEGILYQPDSKRGPGRPQSCR